MENSMEVSQKIKIELAVALLGYCQKNKICILKNHWPFHVDYSTIYNSQELKQPTSHSLTYEWMKKM